MCKKADNVVSDARLWRYVEKTLKRYARRWDLPLRRVKLLAPDKDFYGDCSNDGRIRIALRNGKGRLHAYQLIDVMAHELAHLRYFTHGADWFGLHLRVLSSMHQGGVYDRLRKLRKKKS